jgi:hypothetical protein
MAGRDRPLRPAPSVFRLTPWGPTQLDEFRTHEEEAANAPRRETKSDGRTHEDTSQRGRHPPGGRRAVGSRRAARRLLAAEGAPATRHPPPNGGWVRWSGSPGCAGGDLLRPHPAPPPRRSQLRDWQVRGRHRPPAPGFFWRGRARRDRDSQRPHATPPSQASGWPPQGRERQHEGTADVSGTRERVPRATPCEPDGEQKPPTARRDRDPLGGATG